MRGLQREEKEDHSIFLFAVLADEWFWGFLWFGTPEIRRPGIFTELMPSNISDNWSTSPMVPYGGVQVMMKHKQAGKMKWTTFVFSLTNNIEEAQISWLYCLDIPLYPQK